MSDSRRSVLVTGASSGIGKQTALMLRQRGWQVLTTARKQTDLETLEAAGLNPIPLELADPASVERAANLALAATDGQLYGLFNNGAYGQPGAVEDLSRPVLEAQFAANLFGTIDLTNRLLPAMRQNGRGRIVMNSSVLGFVCMPYRGAYNASKYALEGITDTLRMELAGSGVQVSLIQPGPILSRFRANAYAAFLANIDREHSVHSARYRRMEATFTAKGAVMPGTLGPEAVAKQVIHALEARRPKIRYRVTLATHLFAWLKRLLTDRALDRILKRA